MPHATAGAHPGVVAGPDTAQLAQVELLHDPGGELGIGEVLAAAAGGKFQPIQHPQSAGVRSGHVWLRLSVWGGNDAASRYWLLLNSPLLLEAQLYTPTPTGYEAAATISLLDRPDTRALPYRMPIFELEPAAGTTRVYFIRLRAATVLWVAPRLLRHPQLLDWLIWQHLIVGVMLAGHVLFLLSCLWFAHHLRDRSYLWLAGLTGANLLFSLGIDTLWFQYLLPERPQWVLPLISAFWVVRVPLAATFLISHLGYQGRPAARLYLVLLAAAALLDWLWCLQSGPLLWARWYQPWSIAQLCVFILLAGHKAYRGERGAPLLLLAFVLPLLGAASALWQAIPGQPLAPWTEHGLRIGFMGFLLVMHYAAIRRYQGLRLLAQDARDEALRVARAAEAALEARVAARTRELDAALAAAQSALSAEEGAREEQRQFFLTMQHELRTPLAVIDAANRNLQSDLPPDFEAARLRCQRIGRAVEQLNTLIKRSLRIHRLDRGPERTQQGWTEMRPLLHEAADAARLLSAGHTVALDLDEVPQHWVCDPALTVLALHTLAINAVKYTQAGTRVVIGGHHDTEGLYLTVRDDGPGVAAGDLPRLFERYFRGHNAVGIPGTGLGLPLARKMIAMQGGHLDLHSVEGQGLTAVIWLPRHHEAGETPASP